MKLGIILVRFGIPDIEKEVVSTLFENTVSKEWTLHIVDNWGNPESLTEVWNRKCQDVISAGSTGIVLLNNDCWVAPGWNLEIEAAFARNHELGICGPHSNCGSQTAPGEVPAPVLLERGCPHPGWLANAAAKCRENWAGRTRPCEIYGHCMVIAARAFCALEGFQAELLRGYTLYGSEQSFSARARARGWASELAMGSYAYHLGQASGRRLPPGALAREQERGRQIFGSTPL